MRMFRWMSYNTLKDQIKMNIYIISQKQHHQREWSKMVLVVYIGGKQMQQLEELFVFLGVEELKNLVQLDLT